MISQAILGGLQNSGLSVEITNEDIETEILDEAILSVVRKCGNLEEVIDAAVAGIDRGGFLLRMGRRYPLESTSSAGFAKGSALISNFEN